MKGILTLNARKLSTNAGMECLTLSAYWVTPLEALNIKYRVENDFSLEDGDTNITADFYDENNCFIGELDSINVYQIF